MEKYLIDACVVLGLVNTRDAHHKKCKKFFDDHPHNLFYFASHSLFESHSGQERRISEGDFVAWSVNYKFPHKNFIPIDLNLYTTCKELKLFELFNRLNGMDLIYACLAKIKNFTLVTCDNHFDRYTEKIRILKLAD